MNAQLGPASQMQLAMHFHSQGQLDSARVLYESLLAQFPQAFDVLQQLGLLESQAHRPERALTCFSRAVELNPKDANAYNNLGFTLQTLAREDEALDAYAQAHALAPGDPDVAINLSGLYKKRNQLAPSLACLDTALLTQPAHVALLSNRGNVLQLLGRQAEAVACYEQALVQHPDHPVVLCNLSNALIELGRYEDALRRMAHAVDKHPDQASVWVEHGNALKMLDRTDDAVASYERALRIDPQGVQAQTNLAATLLHDAADRAERAITASQRSLAVFLSSTWGAARSGQAMPALGVVKLRHDVQQAEWLRAHGYALKGLAEFIDTGEALLRKAAQSTEASLVRPSPADMRRMQAFLSTPWVLTMPELPEVLNPALDWRALEDAYLAGTPEILTIDGFLAAPALEAFQRFAWASRVWHGEYANHYLGAFANRGFSSPLHLQLARELKKAMPRVFQDYQLTQLWGFKYEPKVTRGINVHADFAKVNLNFWIAPEEANLDPNSGGLKVFDVPAPDDWTFEQYNIDSERIYAFLEQRGAQAVTVPHRCNRAVLFNSALFHETDHIHFADRYEMRRVNMTYLFGRQLR